MMDAPAIVPPASTEDFPMPAPAHAAPADGTYTTADLCKLLGLSLRTVRRLIAAGRIPGKVKLPARRLRWSRAKVDAWIAAGR